MKKRGLNREKKEKKSKGLSTVIATLLIILLTLVVIGILWVVIKNVIINQSEIAGAQKEFFAENVEILSFRVNGSLVNFSLKKIGGEIISKTENTTETVEIIETDIFSVIDLSGSMTQCIGISNTCCTNVMDGTSYDSGGDICYGASTDKNSECISTCKGSWNLLSGNSNGNFNSYTWSGTQWSSDSTIRGGLSDVGSSSMPSLFYKDSTWNIIIGESDGVFNGYVWSGTQWTANSTVINNLPDVGSNSAPAVFNKDSSWYLITGESGGAFRGFVWDGTQWQPDSAINSSLPDVGSNSAPYVFYKDSSWYLIAGESDGVFNGYVWSGIQWTANSTIINNLPDVGSNSAPYVFYKDSSWYLIAGESDGVFNGYVWSGIQWTANSTIINNLPDIGSNSVPFALYISAVWIDRLTPTKQANKEMINSILSVSEENRIGFIAYSTDVIDTASLDLTKDGALLNSTIDSWQPSTSTCICCGINEAADRLDSQSDEEKSKKIIVMSDGEANIECPRQNTGDAVEDAVESSCDAKTSIQNLIVHSIGAGEGVNEEALINISACGGGKYFSAINISELIDVYKQVAEEIRSSQKPINKFNYLYVVFYNETSSYREKLFDIPDPLATRRYQFDLTGKLEGNIIKVEIFPVIVSESGKEIIGPLFDSWEA